jgi:aldehyde dehydrogenase (NAD+)
VYKFLSYNLFLVPEASEEDTNAAVAAAKAAFPGWSALSPTQRGKYFKSLANLIRGANDELAYLEAISMGRPITQYPDARAAAAEFDYFSEAFLTPLGTSSLNTPHFINLSFRQPYGVAAAIIPWNMPLLFFARKAAPALIAGNTIVLKSSEKAPLTVRPNSSFIEVDGFV